MKWLIKFNNGETPKVSSDIIKKPKPLSILCSMQTIKQ